MCTCIRPAPTCTRRSTATDRPFRVTLTIRDADTRHQHQNTLNALRNTAGGTSISCSVYISSSLRARIIAEIPCGVGLSPATKKIGRKRARHEPAALRPRPGTPGLDGPDGPDGYTDPAADRPSPDRRDAIGPVEPDPGPVPTRPGSAQPASAARRIHSGDHPIVPTRRRRQRWRTACSAPPAAAPVRPAGIPPARAPSSVPT
ncbi:hypothetical protein Franean1_1294 [Parafrankia sp. EAN1pec]|nr:hypothetical protein Franean1_1294 [Frankia sp. EAN1pec]